MGRLLLCGGGWIEGSMVRGEIVQLSILPEICMTLLRRHQGSDQRFS
jgi:hypothetical protein